jgi:type I restriction enzyme, S subunit
MIYRYGKFAEGTLIERMAVKLDDFLKLEIKLPAVSEQIKIYNNVLRYDAAIMAYKAQIAAARLLKKAVIDDFFQTKISGEFRKLESGRWPTTPLGYYFTKKPKNGYSPNEVEQFTPNQVITLSSLTEDGFILSNLKYFDGNDKEIADYLLVSGDFLMSRANTRELVGLCGIYNGPPTAQIIYPDLIMRISINESRCHSAFLEAMLAHSPIRKITQNWAQGTSETMVKINQEIVETLPVYLVPLKEQPFLLERIEMINRQIKALDLMIEKLLAFKTAAFQEANKEYSISYGWDGHIANSKGVQ